MVNTILALLIAILTGSLLLCFLRLYHGPSPLNRIVALDLISVHAVAIILLFSMWSEAVVFLDAAIITAVLGFLGSVMLARYLEYRQRSDA